MVHLKTKKLTGFPMTIKHVGLASRNSFSASLSIRLSAREMEGLSLPRESIVVKKSPVYTKYICSKVTHIIVLHFFKSSYGFIDVNIGGKVA